MRWYARQAAALPSPLAPDETDPRPGEDFDAYVNRINEKRDKYVGEHTSSLGENPSVAVFEMTSEGGGKSVRHKYYLHKTVHSGPNKWQLTHSYIDDSGRELMTGHEIYGTLKEALVELYHARAKLVESRQWKK